MANQIVWSRQALEDLRDIVFYISQDNPDRAASFSIELISKTEHLQQHPELGRVVPEFLTHSIREVIHRSYRIVYQVRTDKNDIAILRIWHGARGIPEITGG